MGINEKAWHVGFKWTIGDEDNPTGAIALDDSSDALHICEIADVGTDWNVSTTSHPTVYVHSATTPSTDYLKLYHDGDYVYINVDGTNIMSLTSSSMDIDVDVTLTGDLALDSEDISVTQGHAIYLDTQTGGEYIVSDTQHYMLLRATTGIDLAIGSNDEVAITASAVTLATNNLTLTAGDLSVAEGSYIYLDGQQGGEYLVSDATGYSMLNATTGVNIAIAGTDEIAVTNSAVTLASNNLTLTTGELALSAGNASVVAGAVIYLDGQDGGEYLMSNTADEAMLNATTVIYLALGGTAEVAVESLTVTLPTNDLILTSGTATISAGELILSAGNASIVAGAVIYLDGQDGGEYLMSDASDEAMLNATTALNLAIGGTDQVAVSATAVTLGSNDLTLTAGDLSVAQGAYIYLDGQQGGEYLVSNTDDEAMLNATAVIYLALGGTAEVAVESLTVTLPTNDLALTAGDISVIQGAYIYLDGQQGGDYLVSDTEHYTMLNGTTGVNLAISGTDKIAITSATSTFSNDISVSAGEFISGAPVKELITSKSADTKYLTPAESGVINASSDGIYLYLPTYVSNTGLIYHVKVTDTHSNGVAVYGYDVTENIDGANSKTSGAQYDTLRVIANLQGWHILEKTGTWS